ncbi:MAG: hypothetical protein H0X51_05395 [Parachlamydiaceae bacterium]|nr:hypothetical protein [Parachlamydiaceae bacterium]
MFHTFIKTFTLIAVILFTGHFSSLTATTSLELQKQADTLREEGKSLQAIDLYNHAIVQYQEEKDYAPMMESLTGRLLAWKHLFYKTNDKLYAFFVKKEAESMLAIAQEYNLMNRLYLIHFLNGTSAILLKDYPTAENEFYQAITIYPFDNTEKGDWMAHLGEAIYRNGRKEEGEKMILQGVQQMQNHSTEVDSFLLNVWISGAYLRLAKLLYNGDATKSQEFLNKATTIIDADSRLVIRKQQLNDFLKEMK